ncbi:MAG TPA: hypothetical protein VFW87_15970 [Pirellulales bacterium]|nr:hypothetical protein [Pirellulales bacterium]
MFRDRLCAAAVVLSAGWWAARGIAQPPERQSTLQVDVERRGPMHEGFAQPAVTGTNDAFVVSKRPPTPLREYPPVLRPAASQAAWLPGYWGWDGAKEDFLWITGVWRLPPPGMRWIPGYWSAHDQQLVWTSGFWFPIERRHVHYEAAAPARQPHQPDLPKPADDAREQFYVPGYWMTTSDGPAWRRGHWSPFHEGWVWIPTRRVATPAGSVLLRGYWDYPLSQRGLLFAPLSAPNARESAAVFTPQAVVNAGQLSGWLFTWAAYGHYCFGDYFGEAERRRGIVPWFAIATDPLFAYERWRRQSTQPHWQALLEAQFKRRRAGQNSDAAGRAAPDRGLVVPLNEWAKAPGAPLPLAMSSHETRSMAASEARAIADLARARANFETAATEARVSGKTAAFTLPELLPRPAARGAPRVGTTGEFIPGTGGRDVPGYGRRTLPGMAGRALPGVDTTAPGVAAPGVLPGADTRLPTGAELSKPQTPRQPR